MRLHRLHVFSSAGYIGYSVEHAMPPTARSAAASAQPAAGPGFAAAAALSRGMADISMGEGGLGETLNYEFKENNEKQDSLDDIDAFEQRLAGGADGTRAAPSSKVGASKPAASRAVPPAAKKSGVDYVKSAHGARKAVRGKGKRGDDDDDDDAGDARQAMSDINKFDQLQGAESDGD